MLQRLEWKEHQLQKEITKMERNKRERKRKRTNPQSDAQEHEVPPGDKAKRQLHVC